MNRANTELAATLISILGGIVGTLATTTLVRTGITLPAAAGSVGLMAALTAASARGALRAAAMGALAGSAAQLAAHFHAAIQRRLTGAIEEP